MLEPSSDLEIQSMCKCQLVSQSMKVHKLLKLPMLEKMHTAIAYNWEKEFTYKQNF